jgi:hypothetical protein
MIRHALGGGAEFLIEYDREGGGDVENMTSDL